MNEKEYKMIITIPKYTGTPIKLKALIGGVFSTAEIIENTIIRDNPNNIDAWPAKLTYARNLKERTQQTAVKKGNAKKT